MNKVFLSGLVKFAVALGLVAGLTGTALAQGSYRLPPQPAADEKQAEYLEEAAAWRQKAEDVLQEGEAKAAKYRKRAHEARAKAAREAGESQDRAVIVMSKGEDKVDKYNGKAEKALNTARAKAAEYLEKAEKLEQKAHDTGAG